MGRSDCTNSKALLVMTRMIVPGMVERRCGHIEGIHSLMGDDISGVPVMPTNQQQERFVIGNIVCLFINRASFCFFVKKTEKE